MVRRERLGKRNLCYNNWHRKSGDDNTMMDIDCFEYDRKTGKPLALIETKFGLVSTVDLEGTEFTALCNLAQEQVPVFLVVYYPMDDKGNLIDAGQEHLMTHIQFLVVGVNNQGKKLFPKLTKLTELGWATELCKLHGVPAKFNHTPSDTWMPVKIPHVYPRQVQELALN